MIAKIVYSIWPPRSPSRSVSLSRPLCCALIVLMGFGRFSELHISSHLIYFMQIKMVKVSILGLEDRCLAEMDKSDAIKRNVITDQTFTTTGYQVSCGVTVDLQKTIASGQTNYFSTVTFGVCGCACVCVLSPSPWGHYSKSDPVTPYLCTCTILLDSWYPTVYFSDNRDAGMHLQKKKQKKKSLHYFLSKVLNVFFFIIIFLNQMIALSTEKLIKK